MCLFTSPAFAEYLFQPATEGGLRLSIGLGAWCGRCRNRCGDQLQRRSNPVHYYKNVSQKSKLVNNFGRCGPIFTIFSPVDSQEKSLRMHHKDLHYTVGICAKTTNKVHTV